MHSVLKYLRAPMRNADAHQIDPAQFRAAMSAFTTGVAVITTVSEGGCHGMTANSLTSVSLDPCLLLVCPRRGSLTGEAIRQRMAFAVNLLADEQAEISRRFIGKLDERFKDLELAFDHLGLPLLPNCLAHFSCVVRGIHPGGDHDIVVGEVVACRARDGEPLVYYRGRVGHHRLQPLG